MREHRDMRRAVLLTVGALLVAVGAGDGWLETGPAAARVALHAGNTAHFADPAGDASGGPDITNVNVSNDDAGNIHFSIEVPTAEQLPAGSFLGVWVDADKNNANDYILWMQGNPATIGLYRLVNGSPQLVSEPTLKGTFLRGATIDINRAALGISSGFQFQVATIPPDQKTSYDIAPNSGWFAYNVVIGQPQPTITSIEVKNVNWSPDPPKAGKPLVATAKVVSNTGVPLPSGQVQCDATVGGVALKGAGHFAVGAGSCTWSIPASAAGKSMTGKVTVVYQQLSAWGKLTGRIIGAKASLQIRGIRTAPTTPQAGRAFYASVGVWKHLPGVKDERWGTGTVSCRAEVSGHALRVILHKVLAGYGAQCGWDVPTTARGATMYTSIGLRSQGASVSKTYRFRVG
jgi:hypothetical protein